MTKSSEAASPGGFEWFAFPADGGNPVATGAGDALRAAGLELGFPILTASDRVLFGVLSRAGNFVTWEIRLSPGSWRVRGIPHQLTFGTTKSGPSPINSAAYAGRRLASAVARLSIWTLSPVLHPS